MKPITMLQITKINKPEQMMERYVNVSKLKCSIFEKNEKKEQIFVYF